MSDEEVEAKFHLLTEQFLPREQHGEVLQFIWQLNAQSTIATLLELLRIE